MILYFSGTGNSAYVAKKIAACIGDEVVSINDKIKNGDHTELKSDKSWVFVTPTYAWRIPRIVQKWIITTRFSGCKDAYFVMTCGGDIGNAGEYAQGLCESKKLNYKGCAEIVMPENYITMFSAPTQEEAGKMIGRAEPVIQKYANLIQNGKVIPEKDAGISGKIKSGVINNVFYPLFVHAKKFYATSDCIGCGLCAKVCPLNNVALKQGKPKWGDYCTQCMACICSCPKEAIEYGKKSLGKNRYLCPDENGGEEIKE